MTAIAATPSGRPTPAARAATSRRRAPRRFGAWRPRRSAPCPGCWPTPADDAELLEVLDAALLRPRLALVADILRRGIARGELRADLDVELTAEILLGPSIVRVLRSGGDRTSVEGFPMRVWDSLMAGMSARPRPVRARRRMFLDPRPG